VRVGSTAIKKLSLFKIGFFQLGFIKLRLINYWQPWEVQSE